MPDARTVYRWQEDLGDDLVYFPAISTVALGLTHVHLLVRDANASWEAFPYAVSASWVVRRPGERMLYLHCLVPQDHLTSITTQFRHNHDVTIITTGDGWQILDALRDPASPAPVATEAGNLLKAYPLIIPVIFETLEARRSYPATWEATAAAWASASGSSFLASPVAFLTTGNSTSAKPSTSSVMRTWCANT